MRSFGGGRGGRRWAHSELRSRWRSLAALGLVAGVTAGLASASVAGARRSDAAWDRLRAESLASDAVVHASQAGIGDPDWGPIVALPYIEAAGAFSIAFGADGTSVIVSQFGDWLTEVDRPRIIEGRLPDPDDPTEVVAEVPSGATDSDTPVYRVGDSITVPFLDPAEDSEAGPPTGPEVTLRVVGLSESPFTMNAFPIMAGGLFAGPAFREAYPDTIAPFSNLLVRVRDPATDLRRLEADVARLFPDASVPVTDLAVAASRVTNGTDLERTGLLLFGLAVALTGAVVVGQALARAVRAASGDLGALRAIGFDRRDSAGALAAPHLLSAVTAGATSVGVAVALSPRFPIGLGRRVDPDVGLHLDLPVVLGGAALMGSLLAGAVLATAWRVAGPTRSGPGERRSVLVGGLQRAGAPLPAVVGASLAVEAGRGGRALPTRAALAASIIGVLGVVAAMVFLGGLDDAGAHAERFGAVWDLEGEVFDGAPDESFFALPDTFADDPDVAGVARIGRFRAPIGDLVVPFYAIDAVSGPPTSFVTLEGRAPGSRGELVLGPDTASVLGLGIGDVVEVGDANRFRVVGIGLLPTTPHSSFDQGAWVVPNDIAAVLPTTLLASMGSSFGMDLTDLETLDDVFFSQGFVGATVRDGSDPDDVAARVGARAGETVAIASAQPPADQISMRNVRSLPILFAVFTPLVALGALVHLALSVVHRRKQDLAILRTLGLTRRQVASCLVCQSTLLAVVGVVVGAPLGLALGRTAWGLVAEQTPMVHVTPAAAIPVLLLLPGVVLVANLATARPAWRSARAPAAAGLRTD